MIPPRFYPVAARVAGRLGLAQSLEDAAVNVTDVAPEDTEPMRPVTIFPEDREKIVSAGSGSTLEKELLRLDSHEGINVSTRRYELRNALATPFGVYQLRGSHLPSGGLDLSALLGARIHRREAGFYAATHVSHSFFGHWIMDGLPASLLREPDEDLVLPIPPNWRKMGAYTPHTLAYAEKLELERRTEDYIFYDRLTLCRDFGQNPHRRARTAEIRDRVQHAIAKQGTSRPSASGVYLARGDTGSVRRLLNEDALISALEARGFETVPINAPLEEIWAKVYGTPQVVSLEGSHMAHAILAARADALHIAINPADRFYLAFADYTAALDIRLATVVAPRDGEGWRVDVDSVLRMLDREAP